MKGMAVELEIEVHTEMDLDSQRRRTSSMVPLMTTLKATTSPVTEETHHTDHPINGKDYFAWISSRTTSFSEYI